MLNNLQSRGPLQFSALLNHLLQQLMQDVIGIDCDRVRCGDCMA